MTSYTPEKKFTKLSPKLDIVFQALFGEVGSEAITSRFLKRVFPITIS